MKKISVIVLLCAASLLPFSCALFQGHGGAVSTGCYYATEVCNAAQVLCTVLGDSTSSSAAIASARAQFLSQVQLVSAEAARRITIQQQKGN